MRLADTLLEDEEADKVTNQIYDIIQSEYPLEEPDHKRHRAALEISPKHKLLRKRGPYGNRRRISGSSGTSESLAGTQHRCRSKMDMEGPDGNPGHEDLT